MKELVAKLKVKGSGAGEIFEPVIGSLFAINSAFEKLIFVLFIM